jgi:peptidyl-prolyl cis-trans isomerase C
MRSAPEHDGEGRRETDEEAAIRTLVEVEVTAPHADEETVRRYYESNRHRFRSPDLYEVRHILLAAEPSEVGGKEALAARAGALAEAVAHDADRFSELAVQWSACPSAKSGGKLGQIGPGQTVPEFEHGLAAMSEGATAIVETRYGLHVVRLDRRIEGQHLPFDIVRERIADWLDQKVRRTAIRQYIGLLAGRAEIKGIDLATIRSPLVQ